MVVTRLDRRLTARDIDSLPHEWDTRYELIGGTLFMSRRPPFHHQDISARLMISLGPDILRQAGHVVPEPGIVWEDEGDDNVSPDLAVLLGEAPARGEKLRRCPDIVVEVVSAGDENRHRDLVAKRELYYRRGAREYWILDPDQGEVLRLSRGEADWSAERLIGSDVVSTPLVPSWSGIAVADLLR